jgi:hypothetical protein
MKWLKRIGITLVVLLAAIALYLNFYLGKSVKLFLEKGGPIALGVPLKLESAEFRLLRGTVTLKGFVLGNPEGFTSDHAISVDEITVELVPKSVFTDTIEIKRVYINAPDINYELGLGTSNIGAIGDKAAGEKKTEAEKEEAEPARTKKKFIIDDFLIEHGKVKVAGVPIPLPAIHLKDIGKEEGGASPREVVKQVFASLVHAITSVVSGAGKLVGEGAEAVGDAVKETGKAVEDAVKGLFGK